MNLRENSIAIQSMELGKDESLYLYCHVYFLKDDRM